MYELGWFSCPSAFGATPRPAPAYPCTHSLIFGAYGSHCAALKKEDTFWGHHMAGRPPWSADHGAATLYKRWCTGVVMGTLLFLVALVPRQVLLSSALFSLVSLQVQKKKKKNMPSFASSFPFRVYLLLFARMCLCWYYYLARTVFWCVIAHKNDFVECYHPQERFLWEATMPRKDY